MKGLYKRLIARGLLGVLLLSFVTTNCINLSFASTSNELREYLGLQPNKYISTDEPDVIYDNTTVEKTIESLSEEDLRSDYIYEIGSNIVSTEEQEKLVDQLEARVNTRIKNNSTAYLIIESIDELISARNELEDLKESQSSLNNGYATDYNIKIDANLNKPNISEVLSEESNSQDIVNNNYVEYDSRRDIKSLDYNIGGIGQYATSVVDNYFILVTPWGFTKHALEEHYNSSKLLGMNLYAKEGDAILSQWNGVVVDISNDSTNSLKKIKIYHGNSTYTEYSHVVPNDGIKVGTAVYQGQTIAKAGNTVQFDDNLDNHIFYQIKLNGSYINPILIYGTQGKYLYEKWLTTYPYDNVIEAGEKYYNTSDEIPETEEESLIKEIMYPDFNK